MWAAVFADVGVSVIAILNAIRAMKVKRFRRILAVLTGLEMRRILK